MSTATGDRAMAQPELEKEDIPGNTAVDNEAPHNTNTTSDTSSTTDNHNQIPEVEKAAKPAAFDASTIPNGGLQAWLQVAGGFSLFFNTFGNIILSFLGSFLSFTKYKIFQYVGSMNQE